MNASELYDIVKDVPHEAWPSRVAYMTLLEQPGPEKFWHIGDDVVPADHASLMFFAAFTQHLIGEGYHSFEWGGDDNGITTTLTLYDLIEVTIENVPGVDSGLACLADAIKQLEAE